MSVPGFNTWTILINFILLTQPMFISGRVIKGAERISGRATCCSGNACSMFTSICGGILISIVALSVFATNMVAWFAYPFTYVVSLDIVSFYTNMFVIIVLIINVVMTFVAYCSIPANMQTNVSTFKCLWITYTILNSVYTFNMIL